MLGSIGAQFVALIVGSDQGPVWLYIEAQQSVAEGVEGQGSLAGTAACIVGKNGLPAAAAQGLHG
jgi:hypothetical protein